MKKGIVKEFNILATFTWKCYKCENVHIVKNYYINPYRIPSQDMPDEQCEKCKTFNELEF